MEQLKQKLENLTDELVETYNKLFELEPKVEERDASLTLLIASLREVYIKFNPEGIIEDLAYQQKDHTYIPVKVSNESVRQAIKSFLRNQYPEVKEYEKLKNQIKILKYQIDSLKHIIHLTQMESSNV